MNQRMNRILPLVIIFILLTVIFIASNLLLSSSGINFVVLTGANCLFFLMSLITIRWQKKAMENSNANVFIRSVMLGMMLKMLVCIAAVMAYVLASGKNFNKPAVYISMVIYLVYLVSEVAIMMKLNKSKNA